MDLSPTAHKAVVALLKSLESSSRGRQGKGKGPLAVAYRRRLSFTKLALTKGGGGAGGSGSTADDVDDLIEMLIEQQEQQESAASEPVGPEDDGETSKGRSPAISDCHSLLVAYQAAVAAKKYTKANGLLESYQRCKRRKAPLPKRAQP